MKTNLLFEKLFAAQVTKMSEKFPESIVDVLWGKKDLLKARVEELGLDLSLSDKNSVPFCPVIPVKRMSCISQVAHFVYYSQGPRAESDISSFHLNGFFFNQDKACDLSSVSEVGFLLDVKTFPITDLKIPLEIDHHRIDYALGNEIKKLGYIAANHVEAFAIANMTELLPKFDRFCAINFSWDGFEFAEIFHGRDLKYGLSWFTPSFSGQRCVKQEGKNFEVLIPVYKESI